MNKLTIIKRDGRAYIDSREVAEIIGKDHRHLLRDIRGYAAVIGRSGAPNLGLTNFFLASNYVDAWNREKPCYLLTKMGCELVANKLTGEKGILFTAAYVARFNEMEAAERKAELKAHARPPLSEFNAVIRNVINGMAYASYSPKGVMDFLRGIYKPLGIKVTEDSDTRCVYTATDIARLYGIYSESGRPHAHAVAAIISKLNIKESQRIVVPYGLVGITMRYDTDVACAVGDWLVRNGCPTEIPYLGFYYHIRYKRDEAPEMDDFISLDDEYDLPGFVEYTEDELDDFCDKYDDCVDCPGFLACCDGE